MWTRRLFIQGLLATPLVAGATPDPTSRWPYHPLVFHLDLSILAYHLYAQSLIWPFDPYYEDLAGLAGARGKMLEKVHQWSAQGGTGMPGAPPPGLRGPGTLADFPTNLRHDPIVYRYDQVRPWHPALAKPLDTWVRYGAPRTLTETIQEVRVARRRSGADGVVIQQVAIAPESALRRGAADVLWCFEGGTGSKSTDEAPSQSLMGHVLSRRTPDGRYDVHITFRGSRSGAGGRAVRQALSDDRATGNPDWITDMGYNRVAPDGAGGRISTRGPVSRGFATSMASILPTLMACLEDIARHHNGRSPAHITVTGHSLGGALAQHYVAAMLQGNAYGPRGTGPAMPRALSDWPWPAIKLITFSAPRAGDAEFARPLTEEGLQSDFFSTKVVAHDPQALTSDAPDILARLTDANRPAGFHVLISTDPITTEKVGGGGKHVGKTVYVDRPYSDDGNHRVVGFAAHEPEKVRDFLVRRLADPAIPAESPMVYLERSAIGESSASAGTPDGYRALVDGMVDHLVRHGDPAAQARLNTDLTRFLALLPS